MRSVSQKILADEKEQKLRPFDLRCEYLTSPVAVDEASPRFSWSLSGAGFNRKQTAYQVVVIAIDGEITWDSGRVSTSQSMNIAYRGPKLRPYQTYRWKVWVWDEKGLTGREATGAFGTGKLGQVWPAKWIKPSLSRMSKPSAAHIAYANPYRALNVSHFRKSFELLEHVKEAKLFVTALGTYRCSINGQRVGDDYFTPGFTDYNKRVEYQAYDVTRLLIRGQNVIGSLLGEGWYSGFVGMDAKRPGALYGRQPQLSAYLRVEFENGEFYELTTDESWRHYVGGLIYSDMLKGERFDARMHPDGWDDAGFDDKLWTPVAQALDVKAQIHATKAPPIRQKHLIKTETLTQAPDGAWIFDLGQNMVGQVRFTFDAKPHQEIRLVHGEALGEDGNIYTDNLRTAVQEDICVAESSGRMTYQPTFTVHGFRYVAVYGLPRRPYEEDLVGIVLHSDLAENSSFLTSSVLLNQLHENVLWSQRGNFFSIPMNCPQRDERMGWLADGQLFAPSAAYNMDISAFYTKWIDDIVDAQSEEGAFPDVAPRANMDSDGAPGWGDAGILLPLLLHDIYSDRRLVERMYMPMSRWLQVIAKDNPDNIRIQRNHNDYGDWMAQGRETPNALVATAYYAGLADLMMHAASILGKSVDKKFFSSLFEDIKAKFQREFILQDGRIGSGSQTGYLLALHFGLVPAKLEGRVAQNLVNSIVDAGKRMQVGFLGVRHICPILSRHGYNDLAYELAQSTQFPSWGYSVMNGATTIWENWDGWSKEKGFADPSGNSFNHYAHGSIAEWMYGWMGGIAPTTESPGYEEFYLRPSPGPGIDFCEVTYGSPRGPILSQWRRQYGNIKYVFDIPANSTAHVELACAPNAIFNVNGVFEQPDVRELYGQVRGCLTLGSGRYDIAVPLDE